MKSSKSYTSRYQRDLIQTYLNKEAIVLDVRSQQEWSLGHIKSFKHIEFRDIQNKIEAIKEFNKPIVTVCVSGVRSARVAEYLVAEGVNAINGGSWQNVASLL